MNEVRYAEVKAAMAHAVRHAIEGMGLDRFKETSFFGGQRKVASELAEAA